MRRESDAIHKKNVINEKICDETVEENALEKMRT